MAWIYWDPNPVFVTLPVIHHPIAWYGLFFAGGFALGYFMLINLFTDAFSQNGTHGKDLARSIVDTLAWYVILGTVVGARIGHVFFYGWDYYRHHPYEIVKIWEGGLASHGGAVGVAFSLFFATVVLKRRAAPISFLFILDALVIPAALVGAFIRIGNFFNQEILGTITTVPWAVIFGSPFDGSAPLPRHPVQLYESLFYFLTCIVLLVLAKKWNGLERRGFLSGLFFVMIFGFRFFIEFFKEPTSMFIDEDSHLLMGQYLSIPFVMWGACQLFFVLRKKREC